MAKLIPADKAAKVTIVSHTMAPIHTIALAQKNMTGNMVHSLTEISSNEAEDIFRDILKTELQGALEFVHFVIQMEDVSRAFQQQLTRTRLAAYSAESLRFTESGMKVAVGSHVLQSDAHGDVSWMAEEQILMSNIEHLYHDMIEDGVPVEEARGILPLNVLSKVGMCVSYKTLIAMSRVRMCYQSQAGEWGNVFGQIVSELDRIDPLLTVPLGPFCEHGRKCPFGSRLDRKCPKDPRNRDSGCMSADGC
jgi:thymidylate synthase (FAD)